MLFGSGFCYYYKFTKNLKLQIINNTINEASQNRVINSGGHFNMDQLNQQAFDQYNKNDSVKCE